MYFLSCTLTISCDWQRPVVFNAGKPMNPDALAARQVGKSSSFQGSRSTTWEDDGVRVMAPWWDPASIGSTRQRRRQPGGDTSCLESWKRRGSLRLGQVCSYRRSSRHCQRSRSLGRLEYHRAPIVYACARM